MTINKKFNMKNRGAREREREKSLMFSCHSNVNAFKKAAGSSKERKGFVMKIDIPDSVWLKSIEFLTLSF